MTAETEPNALEAEMSEDLKRTRRLAKFYHHGADYDSESYPDGFLTDPPDGDSAGAGLANPELAEILFEEVYQRGKLLLGENDPLTLEDKFYLAETKKALMKFDEALTLYGELAEAQAKGAVVPGATPLSIKLSMANILRDTSDSLEALRLYSECLDILEADPGADPGLVLEVKIAIAGSSRELEHYRGSLERRLEVAASLEAAYGSDDKRVLLAKIEAAYDWYGLGERARALGIYLAAARAFDGKGESSDPAALAAKGNAAAILEETGDFFGAAEILAGLTEIREENFGFGNSLVIESKRRLAGLLGKIGRYGRAVELLREVLAAERGLAAEMARAGVPGDSGGSGTKDVKLQIAAFLERSGDFRGADGELRELLRETLETKGPLDSDAFEVKERLGRVLGKKGDYGEALAVFGDLSESRAFVDGAESPGAIKAGIDRAFALTDANESGEAFSRFLEVFELAVQTLGRDHPYVSSALTGMGLASAGTDKSDEAVFWFKAAIMTRELRGGSMAAAKVLLEESQDDWPDPYPNPYHGLLRLLFAKERFGEAFDLATNERRSEAGGIFGGGEKFGSLFAGTPEKPALDSFFSRVGSLADPGAAGEDPARARGRFRDFVYALPEWLSPGGEEGSAVNRELVSLQEFLRGAGPGTVMLRTYAAESRLYLFLVGPDAFFPLETEIPKRELLRKIRGLNHLLRDPRSDPRPAAKELSDLLLAPFLRELKRASVRTILFSFDGPSRHLPPAALWDGEKWLVESFVPVLHGDSVPFDFGKLPRENPPVLVFGDGGGPAFGNVERFRGANFDEANLAGALAGGDANVLCFSGPFVFDSLWDQSYLVLGDGSFFPFSALDGKASLPDLDLAVFARGDSRASPLAGLDGDGSEFDRLGTIVAGMGGDSVIFSFWDDDLGTSEKFTESFFGFRGGRDGPSLSKGEALVASQLELMRAPESVENAGGDNERAHPFLWARFALMGNYR
ncbi:MAG: CHAT domain-containing protein [Deltaproteobacteria bacterium]|nr:CHAT domain-containing protein [Deltaproteobacteria bacterium]